MPEACDEQVPQRPVAVADPGQVLVEPVVEVEQPLVAQLHHQDRGHRLGDRPDPVLRVRRSASVAGPPPWRAAPHQRAVPDQPGDQRRQPAVACSRASSARRCRAAGSVTGQVPVRRSGRSLRRTPPATGRSRPGCGRRTPGRSAPTGGQYLSGSGAGREGGDLARVGAVPVAGDQRARGVRRVAQRRSPRRSTPPPRPGRSRRGSRSSRRRTGRARRGPRTRSARPSACRRPGSSSSGRGSRSRSAAWRRRRR